MSIAVFGANANSSSVPVTCILHCITLGPWWEELAALFSSCDVGLVLSLSNPSFVPLEMMACQCAVVEAASERLEGIATHGEDAWLVEPNPDSIADGIARLLEDAPLRERLIENAYQRVRGMDWRHSARQIEAVLLRDA